MVNLNINIAQIQLLRTKESKIITQSKDSYWNLSSF